MHSSCLQHHCTTYNLYISLYLLEETMHSSMVQYGQLITTYQNSKIVGRELDMSYIFSFFLSNFLYLDLVKGVGRGDIAG